MRAPSPKHVETRNKLNATAIEIRREILAILAPYTGKKIIKFSPYKTWIAKIKEQVSGLQDKYQAQKITICFDFYSSISAEVKTYYPINENDPNSFSVNYVSTWFYVCNLVDNDRMGDLTKDYNPRTDYSHSEIVSTVKKISSLETEISALKGTLGEFSC